MLKKYISDPSHILKTPPIELREDLHLRYIVVILDHREKVLKNKVLPMEKILWKSDKVEEMTWEIEALMRKRYPYLFSD